MTANEQVFRPWLHQNHSSTSLRGLEIAIPPGELYPRPSQSLDSLYYDKELPPVPREHSSRRRSKSRKLSDTYKVMFGDGPYAEQYHRRSKDTTYRDKLSEAKLVTHHRPQIQNPNGYCSELEKVHNVPQEPPRRVGQDGTQPRYHQQWSEIISPTYWEVEKGMRWSSSSSCYSREDDSKLADHQGSWLGVNSTEDASLETPQESFYLQPSTYSTSTADMDPKSVLYTEVPSNTAMSLRHRDRPSLAVAVPTTPPSRSQTEQPGRAPIPPTPQKAMTLDDMINYERERFETEEFSRNVWRPSHVLPSPRARTAPKIPSRGQHPPGSRYESIPTLLPRPLTLRQRRASNRESISHFSDHSSDEADVDGTGKIFSQARSSVLSHIRKISTTTSKPRDDSLLEKTMHAQMQHMPPPPKPSKRKKAYSKMHRPYPSQEMHMSSGNVQAQEHDVPMWPPPPAHGRTPSLSRRLSSIVRRPSQPETPIPLPPPPQPPSSAPAPQLQSKHPSIITNYARVASGPDTPLPMSEKAGLVSTLNPILHKGKGVVAQVRQGVRVRSAAEKRRDKLRKEIVFIGPADQYPDGRVNNWF